MAAIATPVLSHFRRWLTHAPADADLVRRYVDDRDEAAFAALVDRHGPMVLGVARRVLGDRHSAEDVLQATFLTLARRVRSLRSPGALASWLHRTAHNLAITATRARQRRNRVEVLATERIVERDPLDTLSARELVAILDEELQRLPDRYRLPLLLCCLEGQSHQQAAAVLGWSTGSVRGRLERGRQRLRDRLARRGLTFALGVGVASLLAAPPALAAPLRTAVLATASGKAIVPPAVAMLLATGSRVGFASCWGGLVAATLCGIASFVLLVVPFSQASPSLASADASQTPIIQDDPPAAQPSPDPKVLPPGAVARLGADPLRIGHASFTITPDGKKVIAMSAAGLVHTFAADSGKRIERLAIGDRRETDPIVYNCLLSGDGNVAAFCESTNLGTRVSVWDLTTGRRLLDASGYSPQLRALSQDGKSVAVDVYDPQQSRNVLRVYDLGTAKWQDVGASDPNLRTRFTPDGKRLVGITVNDKNQAVIVCLEVATGKKAWEVTTDYYDFGISPDGRIVFAKVKNSPDQLSALDAGTGQPAAGFKLPAKYQLAGRPVSAPDGRTLLLPLKSGELAVWDYRDGKELRRLRASASGGDDWELGCTAVSADGKTAVTNGDGLRGWDLATGQQLFGPAGEPGHAGAVQALAFLSGGKELVSVGTDSTMLRWDVATGKRLGKSLHAAGTELWNTRGGMRIANAEWSRLTLHDAFTGKTVGSVQFPDDHTPRSPDQMWRHALLGDGKTLMTYSPEKGKAVVTVQDYNASKSSSKSTIPPPQGTTQFQAFSPCGRCLAAYGEVYQVVSGKKLWTPAVDAKKTLTPLLPVTFSADGRLLCGRLRNLDTLLDLDECAVWEVASGAVVARVEAKHIRQVAFSPDNHIMAYVTGWGLHLLDLTTGQPVADYEAPDVNCHSRMVSEAQSLVFAPDGQTIATGHHDGSIQIWKVPTTATSKLTEAELATAWGDLDSGDGTKARSAVDRFARDPKGAAAFLQTKLRVPAAPENVDLPKVIGDLDSSVFATRDKATRTLRQLGVKAEPALREALKTATPEMKQRIDQLLEGLAESDRLPLSGDRLRAVRSLEVLERLEKVGTAELLKAWAGQSADPRLATEARLALERMK